MDKRKTVIVFICEICKQWYFLTNRGKSLLPELFAICAALLSISTVKAIAQEDGESNGSPISALSDEQASNIKFLGFAQIGLSYNNTSHNAANNAQSNLPVVGPADEGLQLNALQLAIERPVFSNILPRTTPVPGPTPRDFSWGFRAEALYGRSGLPARMFGVDTKLLDQTPKEGGSRIDQRNYFALPQVMIDMYLPIFSGVTLTVGRFGSGIGRETPPEWYPSRNFFYSKTYAFVSQPDQVAGALISANVSRGDVGFLAGEIGVVNGRQNWKDNNGDKSIIGALRWRSRDMQTWVDYTFMLGNEQNSPNITPQMPIARIISPRGQLRQHHSITFMTHPSKIFEVVGEVLAGKQSGDGKPDTIDILTGPNYTSGTYVGINGELRYRSSRLLQYGVRAEAFRDRKATALFPVTTVPGDFDAITTGLNYNINKNVVFRAELRHDWQLHNNGTNAFGGGSASRQTTLSSDVILQF